jgi:hypothetical protein
MPFMAASTAAPIVPEYITFIEALLPWFMPESTSDGRLSQKKASASFTQSTGVPLQAYISNPFSVLTFLTRRGWLVVSAWLLPEAFSSVDITTMSPYSRTVSVRTCNPFAETLSSLVININGFI